MGLFGQDKKPDPREQVREWSKQLRQEQRKLDREIRSIQREEEKGKRSMKDAAKKGDKDVCKILAREIVKILLSSRKAVTKLYTSKAQINSVIMGMQNQAATLRMAGQLQKSTDVMKCMQSLVKLPEIAQTMQTLSKEMMKAGIIEEMMEDTMESMEPEEFEEQVQTEVDKVLFEVTEGALGLAPDALTDSLVPKQQEPAAAASTSADPDSDSEDMRERLEALRS